jgi:hypothetical protein
VLLTVNPLENVLNPVKLLFADKIDDDVVNP